VADDRSTPLGTPVGRRIVLGVLAAGVVGVLTGDAVSGALARVLGPAEEHDPTGLLSLFPLGNTFRYYSITGSVPHRTPASYQLSVSGLVTHPTTFTFADLQAMPQTSLVRDFHCVTGWSVPQVHWAGVRLSEVLDRVAPATNARAIRFRSFDGRYTENMTLEQARRPDVIVALSMFGKAVTHDHGGPVRMYAAPMYGYKSTKWLSAIELLDHVEPGYWENNGYNLNGLIEN
jgi:DMSO/TMAO reductase YedYZ molybdopterin-dependent catalytic subunit